MLVNPGVQLSTRRVFEELDAPPLGAAGSGSDPIPGSGDDLVEAVRKGRNDLEAHAMRLSPVIGRVRAALLRSDGCLLARMSGSGPTCFGLYATSAAAETAAGSIADDWPDWWVRATTLG